MMLTAFLLLMGLKPTRPFCSLRKFHSHRSSLFQSLDGRDSTTSSNNTMMSSGEQNHNAFQGHRTKIGKRRRKLQDKVTNNARVRYSYLKLSLNNNESIFNSLHQLICQTKRQLECSDEQQQHPKKISKKQSKRQLTIKTRTLSSLHMTYFFCGKVLDEMPSDELGLWNSMVRERLAEYNCDSSSVGKYTLHFKGLKLFPPNRDNLIVAMFESSSKLNGLYDELLKLAMSEKLTHHDGDESKYMFPLLAELTKSLHDKRNQNKNNSPSWRAHVTLGNISGRSGDDDVNKLNSWLEDCKYQDSDMLQLSNEIKVDGLALGGPVPSHVELLDWEYPFHPTEERFACADRLSKLSPCSQP